MSESTKVVTSIRVTSNEARTNSYNGENCRDKITQDVIISLPNWLVILLNEYEKEGYIETNKFIADSISDFINTSNLDKDTLSISNSPKSDMVINLPLDTVELVNVIAKKYDVQISDIVFTALGHIIPVLITYIEECGGYDEN